MKTIEKTGLDNFLGLPLVASRFVKTDVEYSCIHDDCDGEIDQCLKIALRKDSSGNEVFMINAPVTDGLRFRNYIGGGMSSGVYNALKVLIYSSLIKKPLLPDIQLEKNTRSKVLKKIKDILEGVIILPEEVFTNKASLPHYFFEIIPCFNAGISVDGDTHVIVDPSTEIDNLIRSESCYWNPDPFTFCLHSNCSREMYNALILLATAVKKCGETT